GWADDTKASGSGIEFTRKTGRGSLKGTWIVYDAKTKHQVAQSKDGGFVPLPPGDYEVHCQVNGYPMEAALGREQEAANKATTFSVPFEDGLAKWTPDAQGLRKIGERLATVAKSEAKGIEFGGKLFATGDEIEIQVLPATAVFTTELRLYAPAPEQLVGTNRDVGKVFKIGKFPRGTELVFGIFVRNNKKTYLIGSGAKNPDFLVH